MGERRARFSRSQFRAETAASEPVEYKQHSFPIWRDRADFLIHAEVPDVENTWEQLWCRRVTDVTFEICCVPFFIYDVSLGDIVECTVSEAADGTYSEATLQSVVTRSGRGVVRVYSRQPDVLMSTLQEVQSLPAVVEWSTPRFAAISCEDKETVSTLTGWLADLEVRGLLEYETGQQTDIWSEGSPPHD